MSYNNCNVVSFSLMSSLARAIWHEKNQPESKQDFIFRSDLITSKPKEYLADMLIRIREESSEYDPIEDLVKRSYFSIGKLIESELINKRSVFKYDNLRSKASKQATRELIKKAGFNGIVISNTNYRKTKDMMDKIISETNPVWIPKRTKISDLHTDPRFIKDLRVVKPHRNGIVWKVFPDMVLNDKDVMSIIDVKSYFSFKSIAARRKMVMAGYQYQLCFMYILLQKTLDIKINPIGFILAIDQKHQTLKTITFDANKNIDETMAMAEKVSKALVLINQ